MHSFAFFIFVDLILNLSSVIHPPYFFKNVIWYVRICRNENTPNEDNKLHKMIMKIIQTNKRIYKRWNLLLENYFILILNSPYTTVCKFKDTHLKNGYYAVCYTPPFFGLFKKKNLFGNQYIVNFQYWDWRMFFLLEIGLPPIDR